MCRVGLAPLLAVLIGFLPGMAPVARGAMEDEGWHGQGARGGQACYDLAGRRVSVGGSLARTGLPSAVSSATYNAANQLTAWNGASLTYDLAGNLTSDGTSSFTWNARGELTGISGPTSASFGYDALGRRIDRTIAGSSTAFAYDGPDAVQERVGGSASSNQLVGGLDQTIRRVDGAGTRELLTDALGSTVGLVDGSGSVTTSYTYEPYGKTATSGSASANPSQFTGREADGSGFYYYRARYYSPSLGRFISEDPAGFAAGDPNLYRYVGGDPVNATDPSGEIIFAPCLVGAAIDVALTVADNALSGRKTTLGDIAGSAVSGCVAGYVGAGLGKALKWLGERALRWLGKGDEVAGALEDLACAIGSFAPDTQVATTTGSEPIRDVDVGDTVLAYDPASGVTEARAVTATTVHRDRAITRVLVDGETIVTTPDHPFLTVERGWVDAGDLRPGERLVSATGHHGAVFAVVTHPGSAAMWDLSVDTTHTFAVGHGGWVVHYCPVGRLPTPPTPGGMKPGPFGKLLGWGTGDESARALIPTLSRSRLEQIGVTKEMAEAWARFYRNEINRIPTNPSARGRADLMDAIARLLR